MRKNHRASLFFLVVGTGALCMTVKVGAWMPRRKVATATKGLTPQQQHKLSLSPPTTFSRKNSNINNEINDDNDNNNNMEYNNVQFHVAPMQGYTNAPLRQFFRLVSPDAHLWTEMEKVKDLHGASSDALIKRFGVPSSSSSSSSLRQKFLDETKTGGTTTLQLGGSDVQTMNACVNELCQTRYQFDEINLNCGCPSIEAGGADFGASLMKQPILTRDLLQAIHDGCHPRTRISLKCRIAVYETPDEMSQFYSSMDPETLQSRQVESLCEYLSTAMMSGGSNLSSGSSSPTSHVILHARPAILAGLNPTKNRKTPTLNYDIVEQVAREFPHLQVTLNGGIRGISDLEERLQQSRCFESLSSFSSSSSSIISSYMAGRWMLRRPLDLAIVQDKFLSKHTKDAASSIPSLSSIVDNYMSFVDQSLCLKNSKIPLAELCLPLYLVIEQLRGDFDEDGDYESDKVFEETAVGNPCQLHEEEEDGMYDTLRNAVQWMQDSVHSNDRKKKALPEHVNWKRLSSSFQGLVGTKVVNKWKRNRKEL